MPRANRRRPEGPSGRPSRGSEPTSVSYAGGQWFVRPLTGATSGRSYLCPGCDQMVAAGTGHVVVWPADGVGGADHRRHWHTTCWAHRERRRPIGPIR